MHSRITQLTSLLAALLPFTILSYANETGKWNVPDGSKADFSSTFENGNLVTLSWAQLNSSVCDLWVTGYQASNDYAIRIASNIDLNTAGTYPWTISVGVEQISIDDKFMLRFIPTGTEYQADQADQLKSPGFLIVNHGQASGSSSATAATTSAASTLGSVPTSTTVAASSSTPSSQASPDDSGSSGVRPGFIVAAVVGAIVAVLIFLGLAIWALRLRRRSKAVSNKRSQGIWPENPLLPTATSPRTEKKISGLFETDGDRQQPVELSARRKTEYYEMPA